MMKSNNFEFLRPHQPVLSDLGGFAELYATTDPSSSLIKLRTFVEQLVAEIYDQKAFPKPYKPNLYDLLSEDVFRDTVPSSVQNMLHSIRKTGNKAAHGESTLVDQAKAHVRMAYDVASWFHLWLNEGARSDLPAYTEPQGTASKGQLKKEKKALLEKLATQESELHQVLQLLEEERKKRTAFEEASKEELEALKAQAESKAKELEFSEAETRKFLIDEMLISAGWDVGPNGQSNDDVGQEVKLDRMPTASGIGIADYVLWDDDGEPLAVIEVKKTAVSPEAGRTQAKLYADALAARAKTRPIIFYTNGVETYIWDDQPTPILPQGEPPRKIHGFYSKDSLQYQHFKRQQGRQLELVQPDKTIAGRIYQLEAIKRIAERFSEGHRKALVVQATGTGKTRVAISLCKLLIDANWAKRILFLCDRRELRKQANNTFKEHLSSEPRTLVNAKTASERDKRIYIATYPAMMKHFESFDVGFFDLIIADESHRSIYNKYRDLFRYFDALQVGLTATPIKYVNRNTYSLFGCQDKDPTAHFGFKDAIDSSPRYLTPFRVFNVTTRFQREGIKWKDLNEEQRQQLEEQVDDAEDTELKKSDLDRTFFNKDTSRAILRNLMENGIKDATDTLPGKSIIFARNHRHAEHLASVFYELYPSYGGDFCRVIDNYDKHADQLIDHFKDPHHEPRIAISVDMLDTGIDVPEIVNLVFAKPVRSYVKFWQMIGRGTRLCPHLFGPGKDKKEFLIFDHWDNFDYFGEGYVDKDRTTSKSLMQKLFESRVALAAAALEALEDKVFASVIKLIEEDLEALKSTRAIEVRENWRDLQTLSTPEALRAFDATKMNKLLKIAAPLMRWIDIRGHEDARKFDLLAHDLQRAHLQRSSAFSDLRGKVCGEVDALSKNLNQVKARGETIKKIRDPRFWEEATFADLEEMRTELRSVMKHKVRSGASTLEPDILDVDDLDEERKEFIPTFDGQELIAYRQRVEEVLKEHFASDPILSRIRSGQAVSDDDLDQLSRSVLKIDPQVDLKKLPTHINIKDDLHKALRRIVGLDADTVEAAFTDFTHKHLQMTSKQIQFISMLKAHIIANGGLEVARLYEAPFTTLFADGIDGVFEDEQMTEKLLELIMQFDEKDIRGAVA